MYDHNVALVVEDDPEVRECVLKILARSGFGVETASDGEEGLECFLRLRHELSIVLIDIFMPKKNGVDLAASIAAVDSSAPILLMSGCSNDLLIARGQGPFPFIHKPFLARDLISKVNEVVSRRRSPDGKKREAHG